MANLLIDAKKAMTYDAIVIGTGISGGWAAKELCEKGLKTLVLERGRDVKHIVDYPTANTEPWEFPHRGKGTLEMQRIYGKMANETNPFQLKVNEQPYVQEKPFRWTRGYQVGGKSLLWARQTQRWSDFDYEGPQRDGFAIDWPIRYADIAPWYSHVERFTGISGNRDGLASLPDGEFLPSMETSIVEHHLRDAVAAHYTDRHVIYGRCAHITKPKSIHLQQGRAQCMNRTLCNRGCPLGGYFSSNASTLPWAQRTGNMTLRPHSVVHSIIYDEKEGRATGVRVIDTQSKKMLEFHAKIIFVNASALASTQILMNSTSSRFPDGFGNDSGVLGKYISWHNYRGHVNASYDGYPDRRIDGRTPTNSYIPRFRNLEKHDMDFLRGYATGVAAGRGFARGHDGLGEELKTNLTNPAYGDWYVSAWMMGEVVPIESNHTKLHPDLKDQYGIPELVMACDWTENDDKMVKDFTEQLTEMFTVAGFKNIKSNDSHSAPGSDIHEMGGARMGLDPKTSILNKWNQVHACKNVFVTDGACMASTGTQNPSLTYMAYTARAANHAVSELKKQNI
jgi:choline dehydrogenase-like flavoprotein